MKKINKFKFVKEELSVADGLVLRGGRVVIPKILQRKVVKLAHGSHQGIVKTKALLRETVWLPGMDRLTEEIVRECIPCQVNSNKLIQAPLQMTPLPSGEWKKVSAHFYGPLKSGDYLLVVMDDYSRYPENEVVKSTSANAVMGKMEQYIFPA